MKSAKKKAKGKSKRKASKKKARKAKRAPAAKKAATKRKAVPSMEGKLINLKVTPKQKAAIAANAKRHAGGNFSRWLRYAGEHFKPAKQDLNALAS